MGTLTIRDLDDGTKERLRIRAARHGRSMEAEARAILGDAVAAEPATALGQRVHARFAALGGADLDIPPRGDAARAADIG